MRFGNVVIKWLPKRHPLRGTFKWGMWDRNAVSSTMSYSFGVFIIIIYKFY